jgi:hypothetical protein
MFTVPGYGTNKHTQASVAIFSWPHGGNQRTNRANVYHHACTVAVIVVRWKLDGDRGIEVGARERFARIVAGHGGN